MPFESFVIYRQLLLNSDAVTKCCIQKIHRKATEAVTTVPYQDDGYAKTPAHIHTKQEAILSLRPLDQASRDFYSLTGKV